MSRLYQVWTPEVFLETSPLSSLGSQHREVLEHHVCFQKKLRQTWRWYLRMACTAVHRLMGRNTWNCTTATPNPAAERSALWIPLGKLFCSPAPLLHGPGLAKAAVAVNNARETQWHAVVGWHRFRDTGTGRRAAWPQKQKGECKRASQSAPESDCN